MYIQEKCTYYVCLFYVAFSLLLFPLVWVAGSFVAVHNWIHSLLRRALLQSVAGLSCVYQQRPEGVGMCAHTSEVYTVVCSTVYLIYLTYMQIVCNVL